MDRLARTLGRTALILTAVFWLGIPSWIFASLVAGSPERGLGVVVAVYGGAAFLFVGTARAGRRPVRSAR